MWNNTRDATCLPWALVSAFRQDGHETPVAGSFLRDQQEPAIDVITAKEAL